VRPAHRPRRQARCTEGDPRMSYLDERMQRSATAYRCNTCGNLVQFRQNDTGTGTVTLEVYRHPYGEYTITAALTAVPTAGPFGYALHHCRKEAAGASAKARRGEAAAR